MESFRSGARLHDFLAARICGYTRESAGFETAGLQTLANGRTRRPDNSPPDSASKDQIPARQIY